MMSNYIKTLADLNNDFIESIKKALSVDKLTVKTMLANPNSNENSKMLFLGSLLNSITEKLYMIKTLEQKSFVTSRNAIFNESEKNMIVVYAYLMGEIAAKMEEIKSTLLASPTDCKRLIDLYDQVINLLDKNKELMTY